MSNAPAVRAATALTLSASDFLLSKIVPTGWLTLDSRAAPPLGAAGVAVVLVTEESVLEVFVPDEVEEVPVVPLPEPDVEPPGVPDGGGAVPPESPPEGGGSGVVTAVPCGTAPPCTNSQLLQVIGLSESAFKILVQSTFSCSFNLLPLPELSPTIQPYCCNAVATILAAEDKPLVLKSTLGFIRTTIPSGTIPPLLFSCPTIGQ